MAKVEAIVPILDCSEIQGKLEEVRKRESFKTFTQELEKVFRGNLGIVQLKHHGLEQKLVK
jgi:hypothetical protein